MTSVDSVGITVNDLDRAVGFYTTSSASSRYRSRGDGREVRASVRRVRPAAAHRDGCELGDEHIELMEFLAPRGRPIPADSTSNDGWFQHVAIIVSDMDAAYARLREHQGASTHPADRSACPTGTPNAGGIKAFYFRDPDDNHLEVLHFPPGKGDAEMAAQGRSCSWASTTPRSSWPTPTRACASIATRSACGRGGQRELRHRAGASEQRVRRAPARSPLCARRTGLASSCSNTSHRAPAGRCPPILRRTTTGTGRST